MKRLQRIVDARMADGAGAAMLTFEFVDTESGKKTQEQIEVVRHGMRDLLGSAMGVCDAFGRASPEGRSLPETTPAQALPIPTEEFATIRQQGGGLWLMFRVGCQDLSVALPDPKAAEALAHALLNPR